MSNFSDFPCFSFNSRARSCQDRSRVNSQFISFYKREREKDKVLVGLYIFIITEVDVK